MTDFYDSATWQNIPRGAAALLYADGLYTAVPARAEVERRFRAIRWITVFGGADAAPYAGACDFETGNSSFDEPGRLRAWAEARHQMGARARVYSDRADAARAWHETGDLPNVIYWVATLDNAPWSAANLAWELAHRWNAPIPEHRIWANQNVGGMTAPWDRSALFGAW